MRIADVLFNSGVDKAALASNAGSLCGATLDPLKRVGDLNNRISLGTAGAFLAKSITRESSPFAKVYVEFSELDPYLNPAFGEKVLYNLLFATEYVMYEFTYGEMAFWEEFKRYNAGESKSGDLLTAIITVNEWISNQVLEIPHSSIRPTYSSKFMYYHINYHFLAELRRVLSGEETFDHFSEEERIFYNEYIEYVDEVPKSGELLRALRELDRWLIRELMLIDQPELDRTYGSTHKWNKTLTRI